MYLHEDRETFRDLVDQVADSIGRAPALVEKDYYVTLILRLLAEQLDNCVFKGGTSLVKGFHVIDESVIGSQDDRLPQYVKLETALGSFSFPTQTVEIENYIGTYLERKGHPDLARQYYLDKFPMTLQSLWNFATMTFIRRTTRQSQVILPVIT